MKKLIKYQKKLMIIWLTAVLMLSYGCAFKRVSSFYTGNVGDSIRVTQFMKGDNVTFVIKERKESTSNLIRYEKGLNSTKSTYLSHEGGPLLVLKVYVKNKETGEEKHVKDLYSKGFGKSWKITKQNMKPGSYVGIVRWGRMESTLKSCLTARKYRIYHEKTTATFTVE